jgi:hypothetical protein
MKILLNHRMVTSRARLGKIATGLGFALLIVGLIVSLLLPTTDYIWISFGCLLFGIAVSSVGVINMNRWYREPRADQVIDRGLKGFDDRYRVYHYSLPAPHVVLAPSGLYVLTAMLQDGVIHYEGGRWRRDFSLGRLIRFLADEGLGRPFDVADSEVKEMEKYLAKNGLADGVEIENALVFVHPKVQLDVKDLPRPAVLPKDLKRVIRGGEKKMPADRYRRLVEQFEGQVVPEQE